MSDGGGGPPPSIEIIGIFRMESAPFASPCAFPWNLAESHTFKRVVASKHSHN